MKATKEVKLRRYDPERLRNWVLLFIFIVIFSVYVLFGQLVQQTSWPSKPIPVEIKPIPIQAWQWITFFIIIIVMVIILFEHPLFGLLKEQEKEILEYLLKSKKKQSIYKVIKELQKEGKLKGKEKRQCYRYFERLRKIQVVGGTPRESVFLTSKSKRYIK